MTDFRKAIDEIKKRRLSPKEWLLVILLVLIAVGGGLFVYSHLSKTKARDRQIPVTQTTTIHVPELENKPNLLERFNEELQSPNHPLRKQIEVELGMNIINRTIKRSRLLLIALDPNGKNLTVQWDEFHYAKWGGFFFQQTCTATIQTVPYDGRWIIIRCIDNHTGKPVEQNAGTPIAPESVDYVLIRIWNEKSQSFSEFDESVARFDADRNNVVIIHGMGGDTRTEWIHKMAHRIRQHDSDVNILGVDWSPMQTESDHDVASESENTDEKKPTNVLVRIKDRLGSSIDTLLMPTETAKRIPDVVTQADGHLFQKNSLNLDPSKTHLIGFSHGCHVAGMLGMKHLDHQIMRLTVLDPSTRTVHLNSENRWGRGWGRTAAKFIDMYASSKWAGSEKLYGHKSYFVTEKGEIRQWRNPKKWDLFNTVADHMYAAKWFLSTIGNNDTRFGYSIDVTQNPEGSWSGIILSTLPKKGEFDSIDDEMINEVVMAD